MLGKVTGRGALGSKCEGKKNIPRMSRAAPKGEGRERDWVTEEGVTREKARGSAKEEERHEREGSRRLMQRRTGGELLRKLFG